METCTTVDLPQPAVDGALSAERAGELRQQVVRDALDRATLKAKKKRQQGKLLEMPSFF